MIILAIDNVSVINWILGKCEIKDINVYHGIVKLYENMRETNHLDITYKLIHIKSHISLVMNGNDLVDIIAKSAMLYAWEKIHIEKKELLIEDNNYDMYYNKITYKSISNTNKNYFKQINKDIWKNKNKKFKYIKDIFPTRIYKQAMNNLTIKLFRLIMKIRSCHLNDLNGHNKYIKKEEDKYCNLCNKKETQDLAHIYLTCDEKIENPSQVLTNYFIEENIDLNMTNILYPFENQLMEMTNKIKLQQTMEKRLYIKKKKRCENG